VDRWINVLGILEFYLLDTPSEWQGGFDYPHRQGFLTILHNIRFVYSRSTCKLGCSSKLNLCIVHRQGIGRFVPVMISWADIFQYNPEQAWSIETLSPDFVCARDGWPCLRET